MDKSKEFYCCRNGLSYIKYLCDYSSIHAEQKFFVAIDDPMAIRDVTLRNDTNRPRTLSVYSYLEFSFHHIDMDNRKIGTQADTEGKIHIESNTWAVLSGVTSHERGIVLWTAWMNTFILNMI